MKTYFRVFFKNNEYLDLTMFSTIDTNTIAGTSFKNNLHTFKKEDISAISHFIMYPSGKFDRTEISINKIVKDIKH